MRLKVCKLLQKDLLCCASLGLHKNFYYVEIDEGSSLFKNMCFLTVLKCDFTRFCNFKVDNYK